MQNLELSKGVKKMNIVKISVATVLALVYLIFAISLCYFFSFLILLLFVVFGLPAYYLVNSVSPESKAYEVYKIIISPLADCFINILDFISDEEVKTDTNLEHLE